MMNKHLLKKTMMKVAIPMVIIATSIGSYALTHNNLLPNSKTSAIERPKTVIENTIDIAQIRTIEGLTGVSNFFHYDGENKIAVGMSSERQELLKDFPEEPTMDDYQRIYGELYSVNLNTMETAKVDDLRSLNTEFGSAYSPNGKYVDYVDEEGKSYIYHVETGGKTMYSEEELIGEWSEDSHVLIKYGSAVEEIDGESYKVPAILTFDTEGKLVNQVILDSDVNYVSLSSGFYSEDGVEVYFVGRVMDGETMDTGIYKLNMVSGQMEDVLSMLHEKKETIKNPGTDLKEHPGEFLDIYKQSSVYNYKILSNGKIVMDAMVDHVQGLYVYDIHTKKIKMLLDNEGGIGFSIAPDESKIVYSISLPIYPDEESPTEDKNNTEPGEIKVLPNDEDIYVANIDGEKLSNITYVKKDTFGTAFNWSNDSKKLLFLEPEEGTIQEVVFK